MKVQGIFIINSDVIHAYLGYNIVVSHKQLAGTASLITQLSGKSASATESAHCTNKEILRSRNHGVDNVRK
jgi:hypothetical protein